MTTTFARPPIQGFTDHVEQFAAENGIHIEELPITPEEAYEIDRQWIPEVGSVCPAEHAWLFTHQLAFAE